MSVGGRTDRGVHARMQVVSVRLEAGDSPESLAKRLPEHQPPVGAPHHQLPTLHVGGCPSAHLHRAGRGSGYAALRGPDYGGGRAGGGGGALTSAAGNAAPASRSISARGSSAPWMRAESYSDIPSAIAASATGTRRRRVGADATRVVPDVVALHRVQLRRFDLFQQSAGLTQPFFSNHCVVTFSRRLARSEMRSMAEPSSAMGTITSELRNPVAPPYDYPHPVVRWRPAEDLQRRLRDRGALQRAVVRGDRAACHRPPRSRQGHWRDDDAGVQRGLDSTRIANGDTVWLLRRLASRAYSRSPPPSDAEVAAMGRGKRIRGGGYWGVASEEVRDLAAWVDFTAVADAAQAAGLDLAGYATQAHFLIDSGLLPLVDAFFAARLGEGTLPPRVPVEGAHAAVGPPDPGPALRRSSGGGGRRSRRSCRRRRRRWRAGGRGSRFRLHRMSTTPTRGIRTSRTVPGTTCPRTAAPRGCRRLLRWVCGCRRWTW